MEIGLNNTSVEVNDILLSGDFTIAGWVYHEPGAGISNVDALAGSEIQDLNFHNRMFRLHDGNEGAGLAGDIVIANTAAIEGTWAHYAVTRQNGETQLYINGVLDATSDRNWTGDFKIDTLANGVAGLRTGESLSGAIDEFVAWNISLTPAQINDVMTNGSDPTGRNKAAYYDFETDRDSVEDLAPRVLDLESTSVAIDPLTLTGDFTISAWVFLDDGISNADALLGSGTNTINGQNLNFHEGQFRVFAGRPDRDVVISDTVAQPGEWTNYTVVRSGGETSIYIDGQLDATGSGWTGDFTIDKIGGGANAAGFDGLIDDVQIWTEARSATEIASAVSGELGDKNALARRYEFDGSGDLIVDVQGNGTSTTVTEGANLIPGAPDAPSVPELTDRALLLDTASVAIDPLTLSGDFTISAYVMIDGTVSNADALVGSDLYNVNFHQGLLRLHDHTEGRGTNGDMVIATVDVEADVWTHVAISRDGDATSVFLDGQLVGFDTGWTGDFTIDKIGGGVNAAGFNGQIDDLQIWEVAKSEPEILEEIAGTSTSRDGLIRDYSFDGTADVIQDATGNSADAELTAGAALVVKDDDVTGPPSNADASNALKLNNARVNIDDVVLNGDFTLSGWFFFDENATITNHDGVVSSDTTSINFFDQQLRIFDSNLGGDVLVANTAVEAGEWTHVSIVREDGIARLYLNGNLDVTSTSNGFWAQQRTTWESDFVVSDLFGGIPGGTTGLEGQVDDFQIWNVARSQAEIASDLTGSIEDTTGLLHRYTFSDDTGQVVDDTGNAAPVAAPEGSAFVPSTAPFEPPVNVNDFTDTQVAGGFFLPVDMTFLPDGRMLVIEKSGIVNIVADPTTTGSDTSVVLDISAMTLNDAERGLLAVEVDPNFEDNGYVYFYHTMFEDVNGTAQGKTTVSRFTFIEGNGGTESFIDPNSQTVLWQEWDYSRNTTHQGGGLAIAYEPIDGNDPSPYKIYITTSDDGRPQWTDDLNRDEGKVHRINLTDGSIPTDNPYYDAAAAANYTPSVDTSTAFNADNEIMTIHSYGLRNAWRASYDQESETLFIGEVGAGRGSYEDIHVANDNTAGLSYGFPQTTGPLADAESLGNPLLSYLRETGGNASVTGGVVYRGEDFPDEYQGAYFYGDWANNWIRYATLDYSGEVPVVVEDAFFKDTTGRVLAFEEGPDGALYYLTGFQTGAVFTFEGAVNRLDFNTDNSAPTGDGIILSDADLLSTTAPHTVTFNADVSDPDGDDLTYTWSFGDGEDLDGDGVGDTAVSNEVSPTYTFTDLGEYRIDLIVTDSNGTSAVFSPEYITVGNAPTAVITGDVVEGGTWRAGETFTVAGIGTDVEDGALANSQLTLSSAYAFDGLLRPGPFAETVLDGDGVTFTTPTSGTVQSFLDSFTIFLTATDSDGLSTTTQVEMRAEQVELAFDAPIEADFFEFDEKTETGDFTFDSTIGFNHTLSAPQTYTSGADTFVFAQWSDGVTQADRIFVTPEEDTVITALYDLI